MAEGALIELDLESVGVVAIGTGGVTFDVIEFGVVGFAVVFIPALDFSTVQRGSGGEVVDIDEAEANFRIAFFDGGDHSIQVGGGKFFNLGINLDLGGATLVADEAARGVAGIAHHQSGGEGDIGEGGGSRVVAGYAIDSGTDRGSGVNFARFTAVGAEEVLVAGATVASSTAGRDSFILGLIPMDESFRGSIVVRRGGPHFLVRN